MDEKGDADELQENDAPLSAPYRHRRRTGKARRKQRFLITKHTGYKVKRHWDIDQHQQIRSVLIAVNPVYPVVKKLLRMMIPGAEHHLQVFILRLRDHIIGLGQV